MKNPIKTWRIKFWEVKRLKPFFSFLISISQEENLGLKIFLFFRNQVTQTNLKKEYSIAEPFAGLIGAKKLE